MNCPTDGTWVVCVSLPCFIDWMDHWQTLLAGAGAIIAAAVSIYFLRKQIGLTETQEGRRRARRLAASRARLKLSVSDTIHYANSAVLILKQCLDGIGAQHGLPAALANLAKPTFPEQSILAFEAVIEATDDDDFAAIIDDMISEMQVLNSRLGALTRDANSLVAANIEAYIMNACKVHAYASSIFPYARRETQAPPHALDWALVISALNLNDMYDHDYPNLHAFFGRARARAQGRDQAG